MTTLLCFITWCILLVLCWPLALVALVLAPVLWLLALPFMILGTVVGVMITFAGVAAAGKPLEKEQQRALRG